MVKKEKNGIVYFEFEHFAETGLVNHCFSTRIGGVSKAPYDSMNLAYHMGDERADVDENFKLISEAIGFDHQKIVMTDQIHENYHLIVDDLTKPVWVDGLMTEFPNFVLTSYYADCVPLLFLDPVEKIIANAHAGWRGTTMDMAGKTLREMNFEFGCQMEDILVGIGPSIGKNYFEVGREVIDLFEEYMPLSTDYMVQKSEDKWLVDLVGINEARLLEMGIKTCNIEVSHVCTFENPDLFFSHRRDGSARGNMAAMIALK